MPSQARTGLVYVVTGAVSAQDRAPGSSIHRRKREPGQHQPRVGKLTPVRRRSRGAGKRKTTREEGTRFWSRGFSGDVERGENLPCPFGRLRKALRPLAFEGSYTTVSDERQSLGGTLPVEPVACLEPVAGIQGFECRQAVAVRQLQSQPGPLRLASRAAFATAAARSLGARELTPSSEFRSRSERRPGVRCGAGPVRSPRPRAAPVARPWEGDTRWTWGGTRRRRDPTASRR